MHDLTRSKDLKGFYVIQSSLQILISVLVYKKTNHFTTTNGFKCCAYVVFILLFWKIYEEKVLRISWLFYLSQIHRNLILLPSSNCYWLKYNCRSIKRYYIFIPCNMIVAHDKQIISALLYRNQDMVICLSVHMANLPNLFLAPRIDFRSRCILSLLL